MRAEAFGASRPFAVVPHRTIRRIDESHDRTPIHIANLRHIMHRSRLQILARNCVRSRSTVTPTLGLGPEAIQLTSTLE